MSKRVSAAGGGDGFRAVECVSERDQRGVMFLLTAALSLLDYLFLTPDFGYLLSFNGVPAKLVFTESSGGTSLEFIAFVL